ncbi:hypothetical protein AK812_SmicGene45769, partial [Symbiodinium microadriaticum]
MQRTGNLIQVEALYREGESAGEKVLGSTGGRGGLLAALLAPRIHERRHWAASVRAE